MTLNRAEKISYYLALAFAVYMPLHVFLSQSLSLITGGLEVWGFAKDVVICLAVPPLLLVAYKQGSLKNKYFRTVFIMGAFYVLLHVLFLIFKKNADTTTVIMGSAYNARLLAYLLLGYVVANSKEGERYARSVLKVLLITCTVVAIFGVFQYFLPKDMLSHVGYSLQRGVKAMFFIDDKPDFPRVMSTILDPNSLGAFLAFPIVYSSYFLFAKKGKQSWKVLSDEWLMLLLTASVVCLIFTFSRSGEITAIVSIITLVFIVAESKKAHARKYLPYALVCFVVVASLLVVSKNTYIVQNVLLHSDKATKQEDPNQLRVSLSKIVVNRIKQRPIGYGPGTAGIVSISNPKGTQLTENYYLQIAYEVGVLGLAVFVGIYTVILKRLYTIHSDLSLIVFCSGVGIAVFSLLNHSWSNEALALQWWLLAGLALVTSNKKHPS